MEVVDEKRQDDYTQDGTVNLQGKPVLRSKTGGWKACSFIIGKITFKYFETKIVLFLFDSLYIKILFDTLSYIVRTSWLNSLMTKNSPLEVNKSEIQISNSGSTYKMQYPYQLSYV
jgi:hypothetical protein